MESLAGKSPRDMMIFHLLRQGKDQETAERYVDEKLGLTKLRDEIKTERQRLQQLQINNHKDLELEERIKMMDRAIERKQTKAVKGVGGTFEQWT